MSQYLALIVVSIGISVSARAAPSDVTVTTHTLAHLLTWRSDLALATGRDGFVYAMGGTVAHLDYLQDIPSDAFERYDPATDTWTLLSALPHPVYSPGAATGADGRIYMVGGSPTGCYRGRPGNLTLVLVYKPSTDAWVSSPPLPLGRFALAVTADRQGRIYALGGATGCYVYDHGTPVTNRVDRYDPHTRKWTRLHDLPYAGNPLAVTGSDGNIYAGVLDDQTVEPKHLFYIYDAHHNAWSAIPQPPHNRGRYQLAATQDGHLLVLGGCVFNATFPFSCSFLSPPADVYDIRSKQWTTSNPVPEPEIEDGVATTVGNRVFVVGWRYLDTVPYWTMIVEYILTGEQPR